MRFSGRTLLLGATSVLVASCAEPMDAAAPPRTAQDVAPVRELDLDQVGWSTSAPVRRAPPEFDDADPSAVRLFFDVLAPYGSWVEDARLGLVWTPAREAVSASFVPYATHGRWTYRAFASGESAPVDEYTWVSDLPWGWVTFHYGRWTFAGERGWAWVPGRRYSGAWVDWRTPERGAEAARAVVGWGPTPPSQLWRLTRGPVAHFVAVPYAAFATPNVYVRAHDLFASDVGSRLLHGPAALAVAHATHPAGGPHPERLGFDARELPAPPVLDRGLQQAWMLATPATASAVGAGPELGGAPRLRTYVAGGPHFAAR